MKIKRIICTILAAGLLCSTAYALSDSLMEVSDTRAEDSYTGLYYGAISSEMMTSSSKGVGMNGAVEVQTLDTASLKIREDIIDEIAQKGWISAECVMELDIISCDSLQLLAKTSEAETQQLWSGEDLSGEVIISITTQNGKVYTKINGESVGEADAPGKPAVPELIVKNAQLAVTAVDYDAQIGEVIETVKILNGTQECENTLPKADSLTVRIENPEYKTDYLIGVYENGVLKSCQVLTKEKLASTQEVNVITAQADTLKVFAWDDIAEMKPVCEPITLTR